MPMMKGTSMMSLGTWTARSNKYQTFINVSNVFLLIASTVLLFSSGVLINFYHLTKLDFINWVYYACPMGMMGLGLFMFAVTVFGFLISRTEKRRYHALSSVLLIIAFLAQLFSVWTAVEIRFSLNKGSIDRYQQQAINNMREAPGNWDAMQRQLRCCGGSNYENGFQVWDQVLHGSVPDSCCHEETEDCGRNKIQTFTRNPGDTNLQIWKDGCLEILEDLLRKDILPALMVYAGVGVLLSIVLLITVVLSCAYVAQIGRRNKREQMQWNRQAAANEEEFMPSLRQNETDF